MLTPEDIKNLTEYQKQIFVTKEDLDNPTDGLKQSFTKLQTSVDGIAKDIKTHSEELIVLNRRVKKTEDWIDQASPKLGLKFEH